MKHNLFLVDLCLMVFTLFTHGQSLPTVAIERAWSETAMIDVAGMGNYAFHRYFMQDTLVWNAKTYVHQVAHTSQPNQTQVTNRAGSNYTVLVTEANLCTTTTIVGQVPGLIAFANVSNVPCNGGNGSVEISAIGGTPPYTGIGTFSQSAGTYTYTVTDMNGYSTTVSATVLEPTILAVSSNVSNALCNGENGSITVTAIGGTVPYMGAGTFVESAGMYSYTVTDANGCIVTIFATITEPIVLTTTANVTNAICSGGNGSVDLFTIGGTNSYIYSWDNGSTTEDLSAVPAGIYNVTITDTNNCSTYTFVEVEEDFPLDCNDNNPLTIDQLDTENCTCSHTYVGIEETFSAVQYIYTYPNPAESDNDFSLRYQLPPNTSEAILQLYNLQGQLVFSRNIQQTHGSISINLPTGMFLVQLLTADNLNIHSRIIVR